MKIIQFNIRALGLHTAVLLIAASTFTSCAISKQQQYFATLNRDTTVAGFISNNYESKIRTGDELSINMSSMNAAEDALFNGVPQLAVGTTASGLKVSPEGNLLLHRLGTVHVAGYTRRELAKKLQADLAPYFKEGIVTVKYLNQKITVLGEVGTPSVLPLPDEQMTIIDALVLSGDVTANAKRSDVIVIREEEGQKKVKHLNLENHSVFTSPWYFVKADDIILVRADTERFEKEENRRKLQTTLSLVASGVGLAIIIIDRVIN